MFVHFLTAAVNVWKKQRATSVHESERRPTRKHVSTTSNSRW